MGRWVEDSGTESGEERKGVEEAVEEVKGALERLANALPRLAGNIGGSVNDLVSKLQNCLSTPTAPPRRNKRRHHTMGVTAEEIARARKWVNRPCPTTLIRGEFKPVEHRAGLLVEPLPQTAAISYSSPPKNTAPPITYDPSASLFTPAQSVQIAVHKAAIQKQISQEGNKVAALPRQMSQEDLRRNGSDSEISSDEEISPAKRLLKIASKRRSKSSKIKRSNTVEIARSSAYCDSDTDDPAYSSDRSDMKRKSCGTLFVQPPVFHPKTENDVKFLDFLNKVNESEGKVISYNPLARGGKHWSSRFSKIKTSFEDQSSDEKEKESVPRGKCCSPFPRQKPIGQPKLPWSVKQEGDVIVGSITVAKKAPGPVNQFTHAPMSAFKPVEKKTFPSSVSGSVKQLASQKFTRQPEPTKPIPSVPARTNSKFQPLPGPDNNPLSRRFAPNKVTGVQAHPPPQAYFNHYYTPREEIYGNDQILLKTPNKPQDPNKTLVPSKDSDIKISSDPYQKTNSVDNHLKTQTFFNKKAKPELPVKPNFSNNPAPEIPIKPFSNPKLMGESSKVLPHYDAPFSQTTFNSPNNENRLKLDPPKLPSSNIPAIVTDESALLSPDSLTADYNCNFSNNDFRRPANNLSVSDRDIESLSPHPYKGCYVYNENNEIISKSPYTISDSTGFHNQASPYDEPIYQNVSDLKNASGFINPCEFDLSNRTPDHNLSVNGFKTPDKSPLPHRFSESGVFYPRDNLSGGLPSVREPNRTRGISDNSSYYGQNSTLSNCQKQNDAALYYSDYKKGSRSSAPDDYSPDSLNKSSPFVVYNNCAIGKRSEEAGFSPSGEYLERISPGYGNCAAGVNSRGDSPKGSEDWEDCVEEKAVVGRVMGEAQCQRAVTKSRRVESRFPNAPSNTNLLRPPLDLPKIPSPILKPRQEHHPPKSVSPSFPNVLHKSESWHQMVKGQMLQAKQAPPLPAKVSKTKSSHTLALPKQFEGALNPESARRMKNTVSQYLSKSPQKSPRNSISEPSGGNCDDIDNVDEAFESIFQECNKRSS